MLTQEQNDFLTQTGPGTPMGELFRRYWLPTLLLEELPAPDCPPVRVKLLGERMIAFRDTQGRVGIMDEFCAHRGVSLWFGRNEDNGLRCPYHGWKYDVTGQCVELPSEGADGNGPMCKRIKLKAYPCREGGGVIWIYMGPAQHQPPFPEFEWMRVPASHRYICKREQESNYLQAMEGGIDSSHVSWLHSGELHTDPLHKGTQSAKYQGDTAPVLEVLESAGGMMIGARRKAEPGTYYWRVTQWVMPTHTMIPPYGDFGLHGHVWVPVDDEHCITWNLTHHPTRPLTETELHAMQNGQGMYADLIPGSYRPLANSSNDYLIDRAGQKSGRYYSGVKGIAMQDASLQESMGPIIDRRHENLTVTDRGIVLARKLLTQAAQSVQKGDAPPALDPATHRVRSSSFLLPAGTPFTAATAGALTAEAGVAQVAI